MLPNVTMHIKGKNERNMNWRTRVLISILAKSNQQSLDSLRLPLHLHQQWRTITKVRLKWVKNRSLDNMIDIHTDIKAASLLKNAIIRSSTKFITSKSISDTQKLLGITVPTLRFIRRYPTLFQEFPHPKYPSLPCFRLTKIGQNLHNLEQEIYLTHESDLVQKLCKLLMMSRDKTIPFQSLHPLKWDMGLPDDFDKTLVWKYPDRFRVVNGSNGSSSLALESWVDEYAVSELQKSNSDDRGNEYMRFKRGQSALAFQLSFPRGYGAQKKVKAWMEEFQRLPYISPYEDSSRIDPNSELMEKRIVGVLHEFLSLTVYKKTKRNYLRNLREELNLPHRFTRIFTRYPGIFYLSLKCKTTSVALKEGYKRGKLADPCPLARFRGKFYHVMRTGLIYRNKGVDLLPELDKLDDGGVIGTEHEESEEEGYESSEDCFEDGSSQSEDGSDEEY